MHTIEILQFEELLSAMKTGKIRPEHIKEFLKNPDSVFFRNQWTQKFIGLVPRDARPNFVQLVEGKPFYCARRNGKWQMVYGGWESELFESEPTGYGVAEGKVYYHLKIGDSYAVFHGDTQKFVSYEPGSLASLYYQNGQFWFIARRDGAQYFVNGDKETKLRKPYDGRAAVSDGGQFCYITKTNNQLTLIQSKKEIRLPYKEAWCLKFADEKLAYIAQHSEKGYRVVWGKKEYPTFHSINVVNGLSFADGQPLYVANDEKGRSLIVHGDSILSSLEHQGIGSLQLVGGKPAYFHHTVENAKTELSRPVSICYWGALQTKAYDHAFSMHTEGRELVFGANIGREIYRVSRAID